MKRPLKERVYWITAATALAATVCVLAFLQIRWSHDLDEAASTRMRANLQASIIGMRIDLARELSSIPHPQQSHDGVSLTSQAASYAELIQRWKSTSQHPDLIANIYFVSPSGPSGPEIQRLDLATEKLAAIEWPASLAPIKDAAQSSDEMIMPPLQRFHGHHRDEPPGHAPQQFTPESRWFISPEIPALLQPPEPPAANEARTRTRWVVVELNERMLRQQVLPELAERYFGGNGGLNYDVAVFGEASSKLIYSSTPQIQNPSQIVPDARIFLFGPALGSRGPGHMEVRTFVLGGPEPRALAGARLDLLRLGDRRDSWELLVKHRKGSLEAALASLRRQHLFISFGALFILVVTIGMVILATRRAQLLAQQQMEFVAGVSHELRTPLAVIASAGDNIADGIITDHAKIVRYGDVIRKHARQLTQLVEQILLFSAAGKQNFHFNVTRVRPADIVRNALERSELIGSDFTVVQEIEPSLPDVLVDASAISHCLQNLISNAFKYSGESRWIAIRARLTQGPNPVVQISVEDRGIGISSDQLRRIFDPFYRSPEVVAAQIRGTGLGLALARNIADSLGGRLFATSEPGKGSTFTLELPLANAAESAVQQAPLTTAAAASMKDETENPDR